MEQGNPCFSKPIEFYSASLRCSSSSPLLCCQNSLLQDYKNFKKSGLPSRIMVFQDDEWRDVSPEVFDVLQAGFGAGKTTIEVDMDGRSCLFDFLRMFKIDMQNGSQNSVAWIDVNGRCFFPQIILNEQRSMAGRSKLQTGVRIDKEMPLEEECALRKEYSGESPAISSTASPEKPRWPGSQPLQSSDRNYKVVESLLLAGIKTSVPDAIVTSVSKCLHSGPSGNSRLKAFQMQMQKTKAARGSANVKFGWYCTSAKGIAGIMANGFSQASNGIAIHLSPPHSSYNSSLSAESGDNGERHLILCRAIMGNTEKIPAGTLQYRPSSDEFDSAVDDIENPQRFIVWSTHMKTHILADYVVSFKSSKQFKGPRRTTTLQKRSLVTFSKLFAEIGKYLPSSRIHALESLYNQHKAGKISKTAFIRYLKSIVGDKVLTSAIGTIRGQK